MNILVYLLWLLRTARAVAAAVALWQQKEYRWDRFRAHLQLPSTRHLLFQPLGLAKWAALMVGLLSPESTESLLLLLALTYGGESLVLVREVIQRQVHRPQFTVKALLLMVAGLVATAAVSVGGISWFPGAPVVGLLLGDRLVVVLIALLVALFHPLSSIAKQRISRRASAYRSTLTGLTAIGITGSYGKSSTKEFLSVLLGDTPDILKTPGNTNTEIGVARVVLHRLQERHKVFICEMGAYRRGEIRRIAEIVKPSVGILTAIAPQHLALFGSLADIRDTKYELIQSLPPTGTAIFNADDPICRELAARTTHCSVLRYGRQPSADVRGESVRMTPDGIVAQLVAPQGSSEISVPLLGEHQIGNVLGSIAAALALGMPLAAIATRLKHLRPLPRTMEPITLNDGTLVIDDSYSANPDGVLAAIRALRLIPRQEKLVVFAPMIELGKETSLAHRKVGEALRGVATSVFLTERDFAEDLQNGIGATDGAPTLTVERRSEELERAIGHRRGRETVILLEGRVPTRFWERLVRRIA